MAHASPPSKSFSGTISTIFNFLFHRERIMISSSELIPLLNNSLKEPNIVFIIIDSVSSEHLPCYGYERNVTPTIDWFCNNSLVFEKAYSSATHTELSQTSIFSSLSPLKYELRDTFEENYPRRFIWDVLKEQGYKTAYFSSEDDGWMNMIGFYNKTNLDLYSHAFSDNKTDYGFGNFRKDYDESTIKSSIEEIGNSSKFFLALGFHATHYPYSYPPENNRFFLPDTPSIFSTYLNVLEKDEESDLNRYDNSLRYVDKQIGVLKKYLEKNGLMNNTIIVIMSDHGENLNYTDTSFRHGYGVYEEGVHVPLLIYIPFQEKQIVTERVTLLDLVPTILNISGYNDFEGFQGRPFSKNRTVFFMTQSYSFRIGMIKENFKYIININDYSYEVYNILEDPRENNNLVESLLKRDTPKEFLNRFSELLAWHDCQIEYYEDKDYENGRTIDCE
jgi:arylsulfatase A-like enzyme